MHESLSDNDPYQELQNQAAEKNAMQEEVAMATERMRAQLLEAGVIFTNSIEPFSQWTGSSESYAERSEQAVKNEVDVLQLSALLLMERYAAEGVAGSNPNAKKDLQARFLVAGYGAAWLDLIDRELPGEPLDENADFDLIMRKMSDRERIMIQTRQRLDDIGNQFTALVHGEDEAIDDDEQILIAELATAYGIMTISSRTAERRPWQEEARALLMARNVPIDERWMRVINFTEAAQDDD